MAISTATAMNPHMWDEEYVVGVRLSQKWFVSLHILGNQSFFEDGKQ